jgi:hypothetical protein
MLSFRKRSDSANARRSRPVLEGLEGRVTPSTFHVNTFADTVAVNLKTGKELERQQRAEFVRHDGARRKNPGLVTSTEH